jgi:TolA-binding protein
MRKVMIAAMLFAGTSNMALAQDNAPLEGRVAKVEKELRAVQRKVFPGANPSYFDAEIAPAEAAPAPVGSPSDTPVAELTSRVDALEKELSRVTAQSEENGFKLRQIEADVAKMKADLGGRLTAIEGGGVPIAGSPAVTAPAPSAPAVNPPAAPVKAPSTGAPGPAAFPPVSAASPAPTTDTATAAAPQPTGDPAEDAYLAGYRLWETKKYPEAEAALRDVVAKYPKHRRASYAQNLLGRAFLDEGKPALAAEALYANYTKMPRGERAPDSLYFLGQALTQLKKPAEACKVYAELIDVYGEKIVEPLKTRVATARTAAKCPA